MSTPDPSAAVHFLDRPGSAADALAALPGPAADWLRRRFGAPTAVQRLAWPALAAGGHVLLSAPTGTGKTLAAFLPVLGELLAGAGEASPAPLRCLYVAPLRALANDVCRSLQAHLAELAAF